MLFFLVLFFNVDLSTGSKADGQRRSCMMSMVNLASAQMVAVHLRERNRT